MALEKLLRAGDDALESALDRLDPDEDLVTAKVCYERGLLQSPDSYAASLGLGIVHLERARRQLRRGQDAADLITEARRHIGWAYFLRQDPYEPLYYLAEIALLLGDLKQAESFLAPLQEAGWKEGPVYLLLAELVARGARPEIKGCEKMPDLPRCCYQKALDAGWPLEVHRYAGTRLGKYRGGPWSGSLKLGPGVQLRDSDTRTWFVLGLEMGRAISRSRALSLIVPLQLQLLPGADLYRLMLLVGLQYDIALPLRGLYISARLSAGASLELRTAKGETQMTPFGVVLPELGIKYIVAGRVNLGVDLLSFPILIGEEKQQASYQALFHAGVHF